MKFWKLIILIYIFLSGLVTYSQNTSFQSIPYISLEKFKDGMHHWDLFSKIRKYNKLDTSDVIGIANNFVAYQNNDGGWPKNIDWLAILDTDSVKMSLTERYRSSTFDNSNIFPQVEYLSKVYHYTGIEKYRFSAVKGFQYILNNQHKNGGWKGSDVDAITFNDEVMTGVMNILLDIVDNQEYYDWLDKSFKERLTAALNLALTATLKCQIEVNGMKTAWCQQHDNNTYQPVKARSYELPSITPRESTGIILFLMRIKNPGDSIVMAIESAVRWLEKSKITGYKYEKVKIPEVKYHETTVDYDQVFVADSTSKPVWARYYNIKTNTPFLCRRDGTVVYNLSEISFERRIGYAWYGYWPEAVFREYAIWKEQNSITKY
jgi:PelA/Pel-15E family pectate lyase